MTPEEMKNKSRGYGVDMSPEALAKRLRIASDLSAMAQRLAKAKNLGPVESPRTPPPCTDAGSDNPASDDAPFRSP